MSIEYQLVDTVQSCKLTEMSMSLMRAQNFALYEMFKRELILQHRLRNLFFFLCLDCRCSGILGSWYLNVLIKKQKDVTASFDSQIFQQAIDHKIIENTFNEFQQAQKSGYLLKSIKITPLRLQLPIFAFELLLINTLSECVRSQPNH